MNILSRLLIELCLIFILFVVLVPTTKSQQFVPGFEDMPLMEGLYTIPGSVLIFDTPAGRLVESRARGTFSSSKLDKFYRQTLQSLGWKFVQSGQFRRENERLNILITRIGGELEIIFRLAPK